MSMRNLETVVTTPFTEQRLLPFLIHHYLESGNAITLWQMPNSNEKHLLICADLQHPDEISLEESETGFVFAPYDGSKKKVFFRSDLIFTFKNGQLNPDNLPEEVSNKILQSEKPDHDLSPVHYPVSPFPPSPAAAT